MTACKEIFENYQRTDIDSKLVHVHMYRAATLLMHIYIYILFALQTHRIVKTKSHKNHNYWMREWRKKCTRCLYMSTNCISVIYWPKWHLTFFTIKLSPVVYCVLYNAHITNYIYIYRSTFDTCQYHTYVNAHVCLWVYVSMHKHFGISIKKTFLYRFIYTNFVFIVANAKLWVLFSQLEIHVRVSQSVEEEVYVDELYMTFCTLEIWHFWKWNEL